MRLIITEKNIAAKKLAEIMAGSTKVKSEKVFNTAVYRFTARGQECVAMGLRGHILGVDFPLSLTYAQKGWTAQWAEGDDTVAQIPESVPTPPWQRNVRPFTKTGLSLKSWSIPALPFLVFAPVGKFSVEKDLIRSMKNLAKKADEIVIATDYDREGELIGSDARNVCRTTNKKATIYRARYSAYTKDEITHAFDNLTGIDDDLASAGECRQDIDLIWGAVLTRYLTKVRFSGIGNPRSAGRVQTPTLKLIVDKEHERNAFDPQDYWVVSAALSTATGEAFIARHKTARFEDAASATNAFEAAMSVKGTKGATITSAQSKKRASRPPIPFNTTGLQAAAAAEGLSPSRTMRIAESLYMKGLISYPRVDNTVYPASLDLKGILGQLEKVDAYRGYIQKLKAGGKLSATRGAKETTDHPPVHPTGAASPDRLRPEEFKLYNLVARRFMATLSANAIYEDTSLDIDIAGQPFGAKGAILVVPGYREIYPYGAKKEDQLPAVTQGEACNVDEVTQEQKQTKPPARYGEGSIITTMEKHGLGTKATRHAIVQTLVDRAYIAVESKQLKPTMLGIAVTDALVEFASQITSPDMTANLETEMDQIASGIMDRTKVVNHSRALLSEVMTGLIGHVPEMKEKLKDAADADAKIGLCPKCSKDLMVKSSMKTKSQFVGCSGWPDCDVTYPLPQGKIEQLEEICEKCSAPRIRIIQFRSKPQERCMNPECETNYEAPIDLGSCPVCQEKGWDGHIMGQRNPRTLKRFARCSNFEQCDTSYPLPGRGDINSTGRYCETCGAPEVVVTTARGPWKICINMSCPAKEEAAQKKASRATAKRTTGRRSAKSTTKRSAVNKSTKSKPTKRMTKIEGA